MFTTSGYRANSYNEGSCFELSNYTRLRLGTTHVNPATLPAPQFQRNDFSLWSVLRQCIGKELSKITMPIVFNEPLSFLQRMSEYMEYAWLLDKADAAPDPVQRMQYVTAFALSGLASNWERLGKPFNPLLGETFELQRDQYRIVCEQVSHHPPVSAFNADSEHWTFNGSIHPKLRFWGKSVEIQPKGTLTVQLPNKKKLSFLYGKWTEFLRATDIDSYTEYTRVNSHKFSKQEESKGRMRGNSTTGIADEGGGGRGFGGSSRKMLSKLNSITASLKMSMDVEQGAAEVDDGPPDEYEEGSYPRTDSAYSIDIPNSVVLWEADPRPDNSSQYYHFTLFAMSLNELNEDLKRQLSPTDCRLRPDIRLLEEGEIDQAAAEKSRLEEKQRNARKTRKKGKTEYKSRWFDQGQNPFTKQEDWLYSGGYWDRNYSDISDIF
ncbi:Oxysterol-binding protein-related protein 1 [Armadillidium nasatum]|uniref:Oxysterol-binding protein n=1 Tax=Armadillidium nasatum TaxID=96803 RepID=A0A5N5SKJ2_9CRUS|nr:Oxysterol-binding protein-related protein 1 [Armadillidium nasatum]